MTRLARLLKTIRTVRAEQLWNFAVYQLQLKSGWLRRSGQTAANGTAGSFFPLPLAEREVLLPYLEADRGRILAAAEKIRRNQFHPFSGEAGAPLDFHPRHPNLHWTAIRTAEGDDIKDIWEPARFCWAPDLARAWLLKGEAVWKGTFFEYTGRFTEENPSGYGENWQSAQEVAIRLILISFCGSVFLQNNEDASPDPEGIFLAELIRQHAERIPPTLSYARAQNNNHWLSEAAGLMTAACVLPHAAQSERWFKLGWREFRRALNKQIAPDGAYLQYSANYHRLMLQLILWVDFLLRIKGLDWPPALQEKIRRATIWLAAFTDRISGAACNFGHNDGALLFPLGGDTTDYRPTLQALSLRFCGKNLFPPGHWDELNTWFPSPRPESIPEAASSPNPDSIFNDTLLRVGDDANWGLMQTLGYQGRPAHDDQLNVHLWRNGKPLSLDAGTYRYNALPPWNNGLKSAFVHNSLIINHMEPMTDAGKFLWLDWDRARVLSRDDHSASAEHTAFRRIGLSHVRRLEKTADGWRITDQVNPLNYSAMRNSRYRLHWLLADQPFEVRDENNGFCLKTASFSLRFSSLSTSSGMLALQVIRAGETVFAYRNMQEKAKIQALSGWVSPTYGEKRPALSVIVTASAPPPFEIRSEWQF